MDFPQDCYHLFKHKLLNNLPFPCDLLCFIYDSNLTKSTTIFGLKHCFKFKVLEVKTLFKKCKILWYSFLMEDALMPGTLIALWGQNTEIIIRVSCAAYTCIISSEDKTFRPAYKWQVSLNCVCFQQH